jgi:hypothetical protein
MGFGISSAEHAASIAKELLLMLTSMGGGHVSQVWPPTVHSPHDI